MNSTSKKRRCSACHRKLKGEGGVRIKIGSDKKIFLCTEDWEEFVQGLDIDTVAALFQSDWHAA